MTSTLRRQRLLWFQSVSTLSDSPVPGLFSAASSDTDDADDDSSVVVSDGTLESATFREAFSDTLPEWLLQRLEVCGFTSPTRIQARSLDTILRQSQDVMIQAETGSGKTLAYLLPVLAAMEPSRAAVQAMIVVPTRELGLQVGKVAKRLAAGRVQMTSTRTEDDRGGDRHDDDDDDDDDDESDTAVSSTSVTFANPSATKRILVMNVLQGSQNRRQRAWAWAEPPHIVIGTPQELCDMVRYGGIKRYNSVKYVVVDEVDACLLNNAGSMTAQLSSSTLHKLLSQYLSPTYENAASATVPDESRLRRAMAASSPSNRPLSNQRHTILASATLPQPRHFLKQCVQNQWTLRDPVHICLRPTGGELLLPPTLQHAYVVCASAEQKLSALRRLLKKMWTRSTSEKRKVLVFAESQRPLEDMAEVLARDVSQAAADGRGGLCWKESYPPTMERDYHAIFSVLRYHDSLSQRAAALDSFRGERNGPDRDDSGTTESGPTLRVLLTGDLGARGLDIEDVTHVFHFDLPPDADTYVHRAGRTGRFQRKGHVLSIITPDQEFVLRRLTNKLGVDMKCIGRQKKPVADKRASLSTSE